MNITINDISNYQWHNYINCACWSEDMKVKNVSLSKKKMLKFFSEKDELEEFHMLLLDNIIKALAFVYYIESGEFIIFAYGDKKISVTIYKEDFENLVQNCTADQD